MKRLDELGHFSEKTGESVAEPRGVPDARHERATYARTTAEAAARRELELWTRRPMSDAEWTSTKTRLIAFMQLLRECHHQTSSKLQRADRPLSGWQEIPDAA